MIGSKIVKSVLGSRNQRVIKRLQKKVALINKVEENYIKLSDEQLQAMTAQFKQRLEKGETLNDLLVDGFATVREASQRIMGMRHYDVQLIGGMVLHEGNIAEMRTGEGKTLMATLAAYLNALSGKGVHIVTVNDYLATRDANWMRPLYEFLGMSVGIVVPNMPPELKKQAYACDIIYGTNNEFGFDYLRDNMVYQLQDKVQRELNFAIVDEVDSILIDEARTPLIISGPAEDNAQTYIKINDVIPQLTRQIEEGGEGDYSVDEKNKQAFLTEQGHAHVEELLEKMGILKEGDSLYDVSNITLMHHIGSALRAHVLFEKDVDYIVENNEIIIIDEHTGRKMVGRRWSEGLHQAVEAKEGVKIQSENQTLASITFQNFFRLYDKLSGMTGTADTEAYEFQEIYNLEVVVIPTNKPIVRNDQADLVFLTAQAKFKAIIKDIEECAKRKQPVLVGTASIETSEYLSSMLKQKGIKHNVLNAKFHEKESSIIANAGKPGAITIATNMAGRGTDIVLGGSVDKSDESKRAEWQKLHEEVLQHGGLRIIGSERHESRRIDNQLRGRAGRQGDPGSSRFYISIEDNLIRIFAADRLATLLRRVGRMKDDDVIESSMLTRVIESAQRKVEGFNFDMRKQLLEYDNVANDQRKIVYQQRNELLHSNDVQETMESIKSAVMDSLVNQYVPENSMEEQWDIASLQALLKSEFALEVPLQHMLDKNDNCSSEDIHQAVHNAMQKQYAAKEEQVTPEIMRQLEKSIMLQNLDQHWREHLSAMDHLRQGIQLRSYAQKNPKQEYKREAFNLFTSMTDNIKREVLSIVSSFEPQAEDLQTIENARRAQSSPINISYQHQEPQNIMPAEETAQATNENDEKPFVRSTQKVGRNDPCPCGSGKKYKQCCGKIS